MANKNKVRPFDVCIALEGYENGKEGFRPNSARVAKAWENTGKGKIMYRIDFEMDITKELKSIQVAEDKKGNPIMSQRLVPVSLVIFDNEE
tara:strand:+ start:208 stop:480 length:273 start_codon:yes stop_codon:yes gene_type:complete